MGLMLSRVLILLGCCACGIREEAEAREAAARAACISMHDSLLQASAMLPLEHLERSHVAVQPYLSAKQAWSDLAELADDAASLEPYRLYIYPYFEMAPWQNKVCEIESRTRLPRDLQRSATCQEIAAPLRMRLLGIDAASRSLSRDIELQQALRHMDMCLSCRSEAKNSCEKITRR